MTLATDVLAGSRRALARAITCIENECASYRTLLAELYPHTGRAHLIGVTGAPGTGKSTLVNALVKHLRAQGDTVAVVAVDPTSPFSGGAVLGDRIRMRDLAGDAGVFIRSMASRGSLGGLARTTANVVHVLDAAGFNRIVIETVGSGQSEVEIAHTAHTTLVVEAPGLGDDVQAIKAGILEIADVLVVNKADHPGKDNTVRALRNMLSLAHPGPRTFHHHGKLETVMGAAPTGDRDFWLPPIAETVAPAGEGVAALADEIDKHRDWLRTQDRWAARQRERVMRELEGLLRERLFTRFLDAVPDSTLADAIAAVLNRARDPYSAVEDLLNDDLR